MQRHDQEGDENYKSFDYDHDCVGLLIS